MWQVMCGETYAPIGEFKTEVLAWRYVADRPNRYLLVEFVPFA